MTLPTYLTQRFSLLEAAAYVLAYFTDSSLRNRPWYVTSNSTSLPTNPLLPAIHHLLLPRPYTISQYETWQWLAHRQCCSDTFLT